MKMTSSMRALMCATALTSVASVAAAQEAAVTGGAITVTAGTGVAEQIQNDQDNDSTSIDGTVAGVSVTTTVDSIAGVVSIDSNSASATALANNADEAIVFNPGATATGASLIGSSQQTSSAITGDVTDGTQGLNIDITTNAGELDTTGVASVEGNALDATAAANQAIFSIDGDFSQVTVDGGTAGAAAADSAASEASVTADFGIASEQTATGDPVVAGTGDVAIDITIATTIGGVASISDNDVTVDANGNLGFNSIDGEVASDGTAFGIASSQTATGSDADIGNNNNLTISATGGISNVASIEGNDLSVDASSNVGENSLNVSGPAADVDLFVTSSQSGSDSNSAIVGTDDTALAINDPTGDLTGVATVVDNTLSAVSIENSADNSIIASLTGDQTDGSAVLTNEQISDTAGEAVANAPTFGIAVASIDAAGVASIAGNSITTSSLLNDAENTLNLDLNGQGVNGSLLDNDQTTSGTGTSNATIGGAGTAALTIQAVTGDIEGVASISDNILNATAGGNSAANNITLAGISDLGVTTLDNVQTNGSGIAANVALGDAVSNNAAEIDATAGSIAGVVTIASNSVTAMGSGNSSSNTIDMASSTASGPNNIATLINTQSNTGDVTSTVTGFNLATNAVGALSATGVSSISGNSATSTAVGNQSVSRINVGN